MLNTSGKGRHSAIATTLLVLLTSGATLNPAEARRGFGALFSAGRAVAPAARVVTRSATETAAIARREKSVDWSEVARKGLDVAKKAFDMADKGQSAAGSITTGSIDKEPRVPILAAAFTAQILSRIELEACVRESKTLDDLGVHLEAATSAVDAERLKIENLGFEIDAARSRVNRSSRKSVNAFNEHIKKHQSMVQRYNEVTLAAARAEQSKYNSRVQSFNGYCNGKSYYSDDIAAVELSSGVKLSK